MALELKKEDLAKAGVVATKADPSVNHIITSINQVIGNIGNTATQFGNLFEKFSTLKERLHQQQAQITQQPTSPIRQPKKAEEVERAVRGQSVPQKEKMEEKSEDKTKKAERIFNELHELIKPYITMAEAVTAGYVIKMAMQPKNKERIINEIAKRL